MHRNLSPSSGHAIANWLKFHKLPELNIARVHVTIIYSGKSECKDFKAADDTILAKVRSIEVFNHKFVVLLLESDELKKRHQYCVECGGKSDYNVYNPYITVMYGYDPKKHGPLPPAPTDLVVELTKEVVELI